MVDYSKNLFSYFLIAGMIFMSGCSSFRSVSDTEGQTNISIDNSIWLINAEPINSGTPADGLLMNTRMVNSVFEDRNPDSSDLPSGFDPDENTNAFIQSIPEYTGLGVNAFTVSLQGGFPGYEGAINTAFNADGSLREGYLERVARVIRAADRHGATIILTCFYQRQHSHEDALEGREAIRNAAANAALWVEEQGFTNVVLEISNEYGHSGFRNWNDGEWISSVEGQVELINHVKATVPDLLVSTSGMGDGTIAPDIAEAADYILIHFNHTDFDEIPLRIDEALAYGKPVVCNEDNKLGEDGAESARLSVRHGAGWGFMHIEKNQSVPFEFDGYDDDPIVYQMVDQLTTSQTFEIGITE